MERVRGVEPLSLAWKAKVIPIYDTRDTNFKLTGRAAGIRTQTKSSQTIRATVTLQPVAYCIINILTEKL